MKKYNFNAGPSMLPREVVENTAKQILDFNGSTDNNAVSDRWLTSSSYFIMKNIMLTYRLPKALVTKWGLAGVSVKAGVENLFTLTSRKGLNPQYSFNGDSDDTYVSARVFNFGLTVDL